jgi:hypothetical protein
MPRTVSYFLSRIGEFVSLDRDLLVSSPESDNRLNTTTLQIPSPLVHCIYFYISIELFLSHAML